MSPRAYLGLALGTTTALAVAVVLVNWLVDPFALRTAGLDAAARADSAEPFRYKALAVNRIGPAGLILGTSRADTGLDAAHPGFPRDARPVYNLALPAAGIGQMRELLVHAHSTRRLRLAVVGLDLESFLPGERTDFDPAFLKGSGESAPEWMNRLRFNLSWRALKASAARFAPQRREAPSRREIVGARAVFQIVEFENFHSRLPLLFPRWGPESRWSSDRRRAASLQSFRELVAYAHANEIDLRLFISPPHARYLELYRRVGWWPLFESWKRALAAVIAEEARAHPGARPFPLWDFSGFNAVTTERVPAPDDLTTSMRYYVDSSHYSREHGALMLDRMLGAGGAPGSDPPATGVLLDSASLEPHLARTWRHGNEYRAAFPAEVAELDYAVRLLRRRAGRR